MHFKFLTIFVENIEASINFYTDIAGLKITKRFKPGNLEIAFLADSDGDTEIELIQAPAGTPLCKGQGMTICFEAEDIGSILDKVSKKGLIHTEVDSHGDDRFFYTEDPNGLSIEFMQSIAK